VGTEVADDRERRDEIEAGGRQKDQPGQRGAGGDQGERRRHQSQRDHAGGSDPDGGTGVGHPEGLPHRAGLQNQQHGQQPPFAGHQRQYVGREDEHQDEGVPVSRRP
jgi:hypothetical protein